MLESGIHSFRKDISTPTVRKPIKDIFMTRRPLSHGSWQIVLDEEDISACGRYPAVCKNPANRSACRTGLAPGVRMEEDLRVR